MRNGSLRILAVMMCLSVFLTGCGTEQPATLMVAAAITSTQTPHPTPVQSLTPTATPPAGIGVPVHVDSWQLTINEVEAIDHISEGSPSGISLTAPSGYRYLVVRIKFYNLAPASQSTTISFAEDFVIYDINGEEHTPDGIGLSASNMDCLSREECDPQSTSYYSSTGGERAIAFAVQEELIDQPWQIQFRQLSPIPFSLNQDVSADYKTEVVTEHGGSLPACDLTQWRRPGELGMITYERRDEDHVATLRTILPDGTSDTLLCTGVTIGNIQYARDGAALVRLSPQQGWFGLALVELDGTVTTLVQNATDVTADFSPDGRSIIFITELLGSVTARLYVFDRQSGSVSLLDEDDYVSYRFVGDNRLLMGWRYLGDVDGSDLEELPEGIRLVDLASDNERMLFSRSASKRLLFGKPDDSNALEIAPDMSAQGAALLSDDERFVLAMDFDASGYDWEYRVELVNLETDERAVVLQGDYVGYTDLAFSPDNQSCYVLFERLSGGTGMSHRNPSRLTIIRTSDGSILQHIENVISAYFSPDGSQLVYSVANEDGKPEMFVLALENGSTQSLGAGLATGWWAGE
jgi:hypothetical protein